MAIRRTGRITKPLHEILVEMGLLSSEAAAGAVASHGTEEAIVGGLRESGVIDDDAIAKARALRHGLPYHDLEGLSIQPDARMAIDRREQLNKEIVPIEMNALAITIALADPKRLPALKMDLEQRTGKMIKAVVSSPERVRAAIRGKAYGIKSKDDKKKKELDLEVAWKLFDTEDRPLAEQVFGGKVRELTAKSCVIEGSLPTGENLRALTFRKAILKINLFLTAEKDDPVRAVGHLGHREASGDHHRYDVTFDRLPEGDSERIEAFLKAQE